MGHGATILFGILLIIIDAVFFGWAKKSPEELFQEFIANPIPEKTELLENKDAIQFGVRSGFWLHFKINPEKMSQILTQNNYQQKNKIECEKIEDLENKKRCKNEQLSCYNYNSPDPEWWHPENLGGNLKYYEMEKKPSDKVKIQVYRIWVNRENNEAYFCGSPN